MTDQNGPERPQEPRRGLERWEQVIFPSYRIVPLSERPVRSKPRWLEIQQQSGKGKDLTNG